MDSQLKYLLVLFANANLMCFNVLQQMKMWRKEFSDPIMSITINPHCKTMAAAAASNGRIYLISDLNCTSAPEKVEQKLKVGEVKDQSTGQMVSNLKDIEFSPHVRDQLYLITRREVAIYDLNLKQTLNGKSFHGAKSDFKCIFLFEGFPNMMFSVHEDGRAGTWTVDTLGKSVESCLCDSVRGNKHGGERPGLLHTACFSPKHPNLLTAVSADGKVWIWKMNEKGTDWMLNGLLESITSQMSSFQVSPYSQLVAVGSHNGHLQIINLLNSSLESRHDLFTGNDVHGVHWWGADRLVAFTTKTTGKGVYENKVAVLNMTSGKHSVIRKDRKQESTYIKTIRASQTTGLCVIILANRPMEVWDLKTMSLQRILSFPDVVAFEFRQPALKDKEYFAFVTSDGTLYIYRSEKNDCIQDKVKPRVFASSPTTCLSWKNDFLITGDQAGVITTMEFDKKRSRTTNTGKGAIRKIRFSSDNSFIIVLFASGIFSIYELDNLTCLSNSPSHVKAVGCDWGAGNYPIFGTKSGNLFIFDIGLLSCNSNVIFRTLVEPMKSACVLPKEQALCLSEILKNGPISKDDLIGMDEKTRNEFGELYSEKISNGAFIPLVKSHFELIEDELYSKFSTQSMLTSERCLATAKYIGDETGTKFWTLAIPFMNDFKNGIPDDLVKEETRIEYQPATQKLFIPDPNSLPPGYDLLRQDELVRQDEIARVKNLDDSLRSSGAKDQSGMFSVIAQTEVFVDKKEDAVNLLLDTPTSHKDLFKNYLHACVISASNSRDHYVSTIQVVATSLISLKSEEEFDMGVELLCLIGDGFKACKVLQDSDKWDRAARIAKSILPVDKKRLILMRWANHLTSDDKFQSACVYVSIGLFLDAIDVLHQAKLDDIACMFIKALEEQSIPITGKEKFSDKDTSGERLQKLKLEIHISYSKFLEKIGYKTLALEFAHGHKNETTPVVTQLDKEESPFIIV